ncbi:hypothetical protein NEIMUCOT_05825 [Neisseria mucosa ATCC 25996]|uniref:Uncharacterized protein n=1 Tax=Neisseria mucosa (strain ATCC 25996 / DSM 4631 / NCTC 10774 / M26) TaxID=546266 RepID=D2ZYW0_NEIM2|nr:hypothetical protein NEIMUCOT_05825 [Neisseria mucosa ATCC 25996]
MNSAIVFKRLFHKIAYGFPARAGMTAGILLFRFAISLPVQYKTGFNS